MNKNSPGDVSTMLQIKFSRQCQYNRSVLLHILKAIEFHGRLGLSLHGQVESAPVHVPNDGCAGIDYNQVNFHALLQFMIDCHDKILHSHLQSHARNATYISPLSQNTLITAVRNIKQRHIVSEIQATKFFMLLADETNNRLCSAQTAQCLFSICSP